MRSIQSEKWRVRRVRNRSRVNSCWISDAADTCRVVLVCLYVPDWMMGGNLQGADIWPTGSREPIIGNTGDTWPQLQYIWFFGMTTAEQVDTGRLPSTTCSCSKWNTDEVTESSFDCICNSCVCMSMCECSSQVHTICIYTQMNRTVHSSRCFTRWKIRNQVVSGIYSEF